MAKKQPATFNMALEIRNILTDNRQLSGAEVVEQLKAKFPKESINDKSAKVAFSKARRVMGLRGKPKKTVRKRRPITTKATVANVAVNMPALHAARKYITEVGDVEAARTALEQVVKLQVK